MSTSGSGRFGVVAFEFFLALFGKCVSWYLGGASVDTERREARVVPGASVIFIATWNLTNRSTSRLLDRDFSFCGTFSVAIVERRGGGGGGPMFDV
jgi:hypothetical protein